MARKAAVVTGASELRDRINLDMKADVVTLGIDAKFKIERIPTGSLVLDRLTGGGLARGRHSVLFGDWQVGKSLMLYRTMALAQQRGETCALIDGEQVFNSRWFRQLGGNPDDLVIYPDPSSDSVARNANELGNVLRIMVQRDGAIKPADIVGIDSVASMLPKEEEDHDLEDGDPRVASLARLMPLLLRMLTTKNGNTAFIWTNQWRDKISRIPGLRSQPGGRSLGFFASTMIEMQEGERETDVAKVVVKAKEIERKIIVGRWVTCTTRKEKTGARPEVSKSFLLDFRTRMPDALREIIDLGMEDELVARRGERYIFQTEDGEVSAHGIKKALKVLQGNDVLREWLIACIQERSFELGGEG